MVAGLSTETNQKSAELIGIKPFSRKLRPLTEFVFGPYLSNGGGRELADELSHRRASNQAVSLRKVAVGNCGKAIARGLCGLLPMHPLLQN